MAFKRIFLLPAMLILTGCTAGNGEGLDQNGQPIPILTPVQSDFQEIKDAVPLFKDRELAKAAARIIGDEAMHWAVLRQAPGEESVPAAFVS